MAIACSMQVARRFLCRPMSGALHFRQMERFRAMGSRLAQIGLWQPEDPLKMTHAGGTLFTSEAVEPAESSDNSSRLC